MRAIRGHFPQKCQLCLDFPTSIYTCPGCTLLGSLFLGCRRPAAGVGQAKLLCHGKVWISLCNCGNVGIARHNFAFACFAHGLQHAKSLNPDLSYLESVENRHTLSDRPKEKASSQKLCESFKVLLCCVGSFTCVITNLIQGFRIFWDEDAIKISRIGILLVLEIPSNSRPDKGNIFKEFGGISWTNCQCQGFFKESLKFLEDIQTQSQKFLEMCLNSIGCGILIQGFSRISR